MKIVKNMMAAIAMIAMAVIVLYKAVHQSDAKVLDRKMLKVTPEAVRDGEYLRKLGQGHNKALLKGVQAFNLKQEVTESRPVYLSGKKTPKELNTKAKNSKNMPERKMAGDAKKTKKYHEGKMAGDAKKTKKYHVTPSEKWLLAKAVYGEARGESFKGQVAVAAVILNRTEHAAFPDSVHEVIYQENAFTAVKDGQIHLEPDEKAVKAVEIAIQGEDPTRGAVYYYNPDVATSEWMKKKAMKSRKLRIGEHVFFK